jgi:predicted AAA+ superfamily ATPase
MINQKVVINYFSILEDLLIAFHLEPFTHRAKRELTTHLKFYYFDVGIYYHLRPKGPLDSTEEIAGAGLETLFVQHLRALNDYLKLNYKIHFWRTKTGLEVDFVLYGEKGLLAFKIKHKKTISKKDCKGLYAFQTDYPIAKLYLIYGGYEIEYHETITATPFQKALEMLPDLLQNS